MSLIKHYFILCLLLTSIHSYAMDAIFTWDDISITPIDNEGNTALHHALINNESAACIKDWIFFGADIYQPNHHNQTPIDIAKEQGKEELITAMTATHNKVIQLLDLFTHNPQDTLFELSAGIIKHYPDLPFIDRSVIVKTCIAKGALVNGTNSNNDTPLHFTALKTYTADSNNSYIAAILLRHGANQQAINKQGNNPLHLAIQNNKPTYHINLLLEHTPELIHIKDADGDTPLHLAVECNNQDATIIALISKGADINQTNNRNDTPVDIAQRWHGKQRTNLMLECAQKYSKQ